MPGIEPGGSIELLRSITL